MTPAFKIFDFITARSKNEGRKSLIEGRYAPLTQDAGNDYHKEVLPTIPAGTMLRFDFGCDSGLYAMADVGGVLHKVLIPLNDIGKIDWSEYEAEIGAMA